MPIVIEVQYQKRLGLRGYSSHSFGVTVRTEVPDLSHVERESAQLYALLQSSVDREMQQEGYVPEPVPSSNGNGPDRPRNGNQSNGHTNGGYSNGRSNGSNRDYWKCSDRQKELILKVVEDNRLDMQEIEDLAGQMFNAPVKGLNKMEASGLIEELLEKYGKNASNGNGRRSYSRGSRR